MPLDFDSRAYLGVENIDNLESVDLGTSPDTRAKRAILYDSNGNEQGLVTTATLANVSGSASSVTLRAASTSRKGLIIFNDSSAILYVKFGATASTTSFTYRLTPYSTFEMRSPIYQGIVDGIWASATGDARVTELT